MLDVLKRIQRNIQTAVQENNDDDDDDDDENDNDNDNNN